MTKLKPCPFCGSEPHIDWNGKHWLVKCYCGVKNGYTITKESSIAAWNARTKEKVDTGDLVYDPLYNALDDLYNRGWRDHYQERRSAPRGDQWQAVLDLFREHTNRWISVEDRLPKADVRVLTYFEHTGISIGKRVSSKDQPEPFDTMVCFIYPDGWLCDDVTHWMPLPNPPAKGGDAK